tara:strand:- start:223 stop:327 length:105 start_codon:yes stop_codon:yes gene_type:complete
MTFLQGIGLLFTGLTVMFICIIIMSEIERRKKKK